MKHWHHLSIYPVIYCLVLFSCLSIACNKEASDMVKLLSQQIIGKWKVISYKDLDIEQIGTNISDYELVFEKDSLHISNIIYTNKNIKADSTKYSVNNGSEKIFILSPTQEQDEYSAFFNGDTLLLSLSNCCKRKEVIAVKN